MKAAGISQSINNKYEIVKKFYFFLFCGLELNMKMGIVLELA